MYHHVHSEIEGLWKSFRKDLRRLGAMLMAAVMLVSSAPLPALAEGEEAQPICGLAEHTHGPECRQPVLTCGLNESAPYRDQRMEVYPSIPEAFSSGYLL